MYDGPPAIPSAVNALTSLGITLLAGFAAAAFLARYARFPGRADMLPGPTAARPIEDRPDRPIIKKAPG
jgi:hypothetical protein